MASKRQKGKRSELGKSLRQIEGDEALLESEERYRLLFNEMLSGFALHEVICDEDGNPCDYRFLEVNPAFERLTGLSSEEIIGKTVLEVLPGTESYWIDAFGKVALTGKAVQFVNYSKELDRYYEVSAFSPKSGRFAVTFTDVTDRKRAEEALRQQAQLLHLSYDAILVWRKDGGIEHWNRGAEQLYGFTESEALGQVTHKLLKTIHPVSWLEIEAAMRKDGQWEGELRHYAKDGHEVTVSARHQLVLGTDGTERILETNRDITEHKRAEEAVRESERRFHRSFEEDLTGDFLCTREGRILLANAAFADIFGFSSSDAATGRSVLELYVDPGERDSILATLQAQGKLAHYETWRKRRDGTPIHVVENLVGHFNDQGELYEIQGYVFDDTERKRAEEALKKSEAQYRELVQNANSAIVRWRVDGTVTFFNEYAQNFFGYEEDEIIGKDVRILVPEEDSSGEDLSGLVRDIVANPKRFVNNINENVRRDGRRVWMAWTNKPILDKNGHALEILAVGTDITKRKRAEEALLKAHDELESRVEERTAELIIANRQLKKEIEERKRAEEKLLIHQEQLRSLSSELSLTEERERRRFAEDLHDSVAQLLVLSKFNLKDVLAKSSLGAGRTEIEEVCHYLDEAMEQTRSLMFELSPPDLHALGIKDGLGGLAERIGRAHDLQVDFSADEIAVGALDEDASILLYRSVQELLMNIVKHAKVSQAKLSLFKNGDAIRVEVEDEGIGCDLSSTMNYSKVKKGGGFGLLSIKERLRHLGGQFEMSSQPGKGTLVTLTVPLPKEAVGTIAEDVAPIRVLIADDHQMMREGLRSLLESQNFEIAAEAKDGEEAVRMTRETNPDVVIMDIVMPVMDGIQATRRILAELPEIKIIGLSMNRDKFKISQALESGARGFVLKGSAFQELNQAIHAVVNDNSIFLSAPIRDLFPDSGEQPSSN